jgi:predicted transcriptional regulator of viral defense system
MGGSSTRRASFGRAKSVIIKDRKRSHIMTVCPEGRLAQTAGGQHGVFSLRQARDAGVSKGMIARRTRSRVWAKVHPGVFRVAGAPATWHQELMAACLWAGDAGLVSHLTAARLHALEGMPRRKRGEPIELIVPYGRQLSARGISVHQSRRLESADRGAVERIPVTSLVRTLVDLAPRLNDRQLVRALDSGLAHHPDIDAQRVRRELGRLQGHGRTGTRALGRLVEQRLRDCPVLDSALERRFRAALQGSSLPPAAEHYDVVEAGRHLAELDFAYPAARLGIQLNGAGVHLRYHVWERDQQQLSDLSAAGWRVLPVTWVQLEKDEAGVLQRVARALCGTVR